VPIEVWLLLPLALLLGLVCATVVCLVALSRADRTDIVAVTRELPDLVAIFLRYRRKR
jgi:ABC-type arginine transport system permease subunit